MPTRLNAGRSNDILGWAVILLGLSWAVAGVLTVVSLYYGLFQGVFVSYDWQFLLSLGVPRLATVPASALLALEGYRVSREGSPRKAVVMAIIGLYCIAFGLESLLTAITTPYFLGPNLYLLQGSVLIVGGLAFVAYGGRGFKIAGFFVAAVGTIFFYLGGLTLPPGFSDYCWITAVSPYFPELGRAGFAISYNVYQFFTGSLPVTFLVIVASSLGAGALIAYASGRKTFVAKIGTDLARLCGTALGCVLIAISVFVCIAFANLFALALTVPVKTIPPMSSLNTLLLLAVGAIISVVQVVGGSLLIFGCALRWAPKGDL